MHEGVDLAGSYGSPIYATADGVVVHAGWSSGYGNLVKIRHQFGIETMCVAGGQGEAMLVERLN